MLSVPRYALRFRQGPRVKFTPTGILDYVTQYPGVIRISSNSETLIIKAREQVRKEMVLLKTRLLKADEAGQQNSEKHSHNPQTQRAHEGKQALFTELSTGQGNRCFYCDQKLVTGELDSVLQTHIEHSGIALSAKLTYYKCLHMRSLVVAVCRKCNLFKGMGEQQASLLLYNWQRGIYLLSPIKTDGVMDVKPLITATPMYDSSFKQVTGAKLTPEARWQIADFLALVSVRIVKMCSCKLPPFYIQYNPEARTVLIACRQHSLARFPICGFLDTHPAHVPENKDRNENDNQPETEDSVPEHGTATATDTNTTAP